MNNQTVLWQGDNGPGITELDLQMLKFPFRQHEHEFLKGNVYIKEAAIANRLDRVDRNWQFIRIANEINTGDAVIAHYALNIKGVVRVNTGAGQFIRVKRDGELQDPNILAEGMGNGYKAATTDAFKRAARLFGVARYLLGAPKEGASFNTWLAKLLAEAKIAYDKVNVDAIPEVAVEVVEDAE